MKAVAGSLPRGDDWVFEIKWDGMRALTAVGEDVVAHSSRGNEITQRFPELDDLAEACSGLDVLLDGELVAFNADGLPDFGRLQGRMHLDRPGDVARRRGDTPVVYVVFDIVHLDGNDVVSLPYDNRRSLLEQVLEPGPSWQLASVHDGAGEALLDAVAERGMEGVVAKRRHSIYTPGRRSPDWVKVKVRRRQELVIGGVLSGEGHRTNQVAAVLVGHHDETGFRFAGRVGSGLTDIEGAALIDVLRPRPSSPFSDEVASVRGRTITFVDPDTVIEIEFAEWTGDGHLRHPVYLGRRIDADPGAVIREPDPEPGPPAD